MILFVGGPPKGREILAKRMGENGFGSNPVGADKVGLGSLISGWTEFAVMEGISVTTTQLYSLGREPKARERCWCAGLLLVADHMIRRVGVLRHRPLC